MTEAGPMADDFQGVFERLSKQSYREMLAVRRGQDVSNLRYAKPLEEDLGDGIFTHAERHFITKWRIHEDGASLARGTLFRLRHCFVPESAEDEAVEHMMYGRNVARIAFVEMTVTEPGFFRRIKRDEEAAYHSEAFKPHGAEALAAEALRSVMSNRHVKGEAHAVLLAKLHRTGIVSQKIRQEEEQYVQKTVDEILQDF